MAYDNGIKERIRAALDPDATVNVENADRLLHLALQRIEFLEEQLATDPTKLYGVTRLEVIDESGRGYTNWKASGVMVSIQDEGRTAKLFTTGTAVGAKTIEQKREEESEAFIEKVRNSPTWTG